ncbi:MAG: hypothetical protein ABEH90_05645 [Halolamina sp.]
MKALYNLNTVAKEHAESAEKAYNAGLKRKARIHSQRKKALYGFKRVILGEFVDNDCVDSIRLHKIDGRTYYCIYVDEFSFHTPTSEWDDSPRDAPESATELDSFDADPSNRSDDMREREALERLTEAFESPNHHIESPFTDDNHGATFVGWSYLPGSLDEGDRVSDRRLHDHNGEGDFGFEIGDTFQTRKGQCEIEDRYHAYLSPLRDRSPVLQRPVYDVLLDGERQETVRQRRIIDDWWILAESIETPLPTVDGKLGDTEYIRGHIESHVGTSVEFEIGDIIELRPNGQEDSIYCRITEVHVSHNLLIGQYEPIPPTEEAPLGLSIHEIADDVIAVHDEPPVQERNS